MVIHFLNEIGNSVFVDNSCSYNYMNVFLLCSRYILSWEQAQSEFYKSKSHQCHNRDGSLFFSIIILGILSFVNNLMSCEQ